MARGKVTLNDIARALSVTPTTVHRALNGTKGVSREMRMTIRRTAAEMGYWTNDMTTTLKEKKWRIAIVLPTPTDENRFYYDTLWAGVRTVCVTMAEFSVETIEIPYPSSTGDIGAALEKLEQFGGSIDGVVTVIIKPDQTTYFFERCCEKGIPVALVGNDVEPRLRLCCVKAFDEVAGGLAAELMVSFRGEHFPQKAMVVGPLGMEDQYLNVKGFEQTMGRYAPYLQIIPFRTTDEDTDCDILLQKLRQNADIIGIYACRARDTIRVARAVQQLGLVGKVKVIGDGCFKESLALLEQGVITAIIDRKAAAQGYVATEALLRYLTRGALPQRDVIYFRPEIVLRSSIDCLVRLDKPWAATSLPVFF